MELIKNVNIGAYTIYSLILCTSGVSSCIAIVIELGNKIFMFHADSYNFNASKTCSIDDAHTFLMKIFNNLYQLDASAIIKNVFIIGGWNNTNYITLREQINIVRGNCMMTVKKNSTLSPNNFDLFVNSIQLNLIGFNLPPKNIDGANKEDSEDDNPDDFIVDFTIIYDRSSTPHTFVIYQYAGREDDMLADRHDSSLYAIYQFDPTWKHFRAFICSNALKSSYYADFYNQVLLNVNGQSCIHYSFDDNALKKRIDDLLSRTKSVQSF